MMMERTKRFVDLPDLLAVNKLVEVIIEEVRMLKARVAILYHFVLVLDYSNVLINIKMTFGVEGRG